jgi:hypothetical protein
MSMSTSEPRRHDQTLSKDRRPDCTLGGADGQPDADLPPLLRHGVTDHTERPDEPEERRDDAKAETERREQPLLQQRLLELKLERDGIDGLTPERGDDAPNDIRRWGHPGPEARKEQGNREVRRLL